VKAAVIVFPGSNCDRDVAVALTVATGQAPAMIWHREVALPPVDLITLPGGFSYGDYLRAGAMAARSPVLGAVVTRARAGVPVIGICNGFQVLTECGLLPGVLMRNRGLRFLCRDVHLKVAAARPPFTSAFATGEILRMPIAHNEGNYYAGPETLAEIEGEGRVAFRYCAADGETDPDAAPNGAANAIAGIFDSTGRVLGLMPHPERAAEPAHGGTDGRRMFAGVVEALS
jgi:phosphoribosylformylglycinamidine synthase